MTSAIPGGAPGYDDDKELGNNVAHATRRTSRRLRETYWPKPCCQGTAPLFRDVVSLTGFLAFGESEFGSGINLPLVMAGLVPAIPRLSPSSRFRGF
jgi:hypothetical protein